MNPINNISDGLQGFKNRVFWVYVNYQDAVEFNVVLNAVYQNYFGKVASTSTIERAGRYWRSNRPDLFQRTKAKEDQDLMTMREVKEVFA